jgi:hypothetical protein
MTEEPQQPASIEFADLIGELFRGGPARDRELDAIDLEIDALLEGMRGYLEAARDLRLAEAREDAAFETYVHGETRKVRAEAKHEDDRAEKELEPLRKRVGELRVQHDAEIIRLQLLWRMRDTVADESQEGN